MLESYTNQTNRPIGTFSGEGLLVLNNCTISYQISICVRKGSFAQPSGNFHLSACATDPLQTPFLDLLHITMPVGSGVQARWLPTFGQPSIEVFYCGSGTTLLASPSAAEVSCVVLPGL